jgi:DNA mismatch repair protein MutL
MQLPPVPDAGTRLGALFGEKFAKLVSFRDGDGDWKLHGFLSPPSLSFRDRGHLHLFVNGRAVRDRLLLAALSEGWSGAFAKGAYPAAVVFVEVPAEEVDVNVHPTKAEVRFRHTQRIFPWVARATGEAWRALQGDLTSVLELPPKPEEAEFELAARNREAEHPRLWTGAAPVPDLDRSYDFAAATMGAAEAVEDDLLYLGAFERTYLLVEVRPGPFAKAPELWIVDQHVAHERVLFERLFLRRHAPAIQPMMPPRVVQLGPAAVAHLSPFLEELNAVGVEIDAFGADALVVRGLPDFLTDRDPQTLLEDLLARLERTGKADLDAFRRDLNAELACRAAIKKHERLSPALALRLVKDLLACESPNTCPHGRPILKKLSLDDLERSFGRRV